VRGREGDGGREKEEKEGGEGKGTIPTLLFPF